MYRILTLFFVALCVVVINCSIVAQDVLIEDEYVCWIPNSYNHFIDSLDSHGVNVHLASIEGRDDLMNMDALLLISLHGTFDMETLYPRMIDFVKNGGNVLMWATGSIDRIYNPMLTDPRWQTTLEILDWCGLALTEYITPFSPFTDGYDFVVFQARAYDYCGDNAFPFVFCDSANNEPLVAISYPFKNEGNCSSFVVLATGCAMYNQWYIMRPEEYRFGANLFLGIAGVPGYYLPPGAIPGGGFAPGCGGEQEDTTSECFAHPSPFTPNGDGVNDYAKFEYPGMHRNEGVAFIYTLENEFVRKLQNGEVYDSPKGVIYWDGKDAYGRLMQNGVYLYIVQDEGKTKCKGTVYLAR